jgi:hypothetical protein
MQMKRWFAYIACLGVLLVACNKSPAISAAAACLVVAVAIVLGIILFMETPQRLFSKRILPH